MASLKFTASQARSIRQYKNFQIKVPKCCADQGYCERNGIQLSYIFTVP